MGRLTNKHILLGVTGGIAAYKSAELIRQLKQEGADVRVVMTQGAQSFITPLTLQALSGNAVHTELLDTEAELGMSHIEQAKWADLVLIAPATADFIARLAQGRGDDLLSTLCLATESPIAVAPAMNQAMWADAATQDNLMTLSRRGIHQIGPASGQQACGDVGLGRMEDPSAIASATGDLFQSGSLQGQHVVITAGPTREAIDPVRYISNHSSGKMGFALADAAIAAGAKVTLIAGPVGLATPERCERIDITSAQDMLDASLETLDSCDIFIACAAVADYRPQEIQAQKIKKQHSDQMTIELIKNPDIVSIVAGHDHRPFVVGFAAETQDVINYARGKLERKNLDMIIANDVSRSDIGFNQEQNAVSVISRDTQIDFATTRKGPLAEKLINEIAKAYT